MIETEKESGVIGIDVEEVKGFKIESVLDLILNLRNKAMATTHPLSKAIESEPLPCSDKEVFEFLQKIIAGEGKASLVVSNILWEETGNCVGDELWPVKMEAVRLPDDRYYVTISSYHYRESTEWEEEGYTTKEYIFKVK